MFELLIIIYYSFYVTSIILYETNVTAIVLEHYVANDVHHFIVDIFYHHAFGYMNRPKILMPIASIKNEMKEVVLIAIIA